MSFCYSINAGPVIAAFALGWIILFIVFITQLSVLSRLNDLRRQLIDKHILDDDKKHGNVDEFIPWMKH